MANEKQAGTETQNKFPSMMWKYSLIIALTLIGGYILLVGILLYPIVGKNDEKVREHALEAIKSITTVFGPWIAALVAFYFAGKQLENVSKQLGVAQETITASMKPGIKRILEGKFVKEIMDKFDPNKHKIPNIKLKYEDPKDKKEKGIDSKTPLTPESIKAIKDYADELKDVKCFAVFTPGDKIEGIITLADINAMQKIPDTEYGKKLLEDFTTDMVRLIRATPAQTLAEIQPSLADHKVLPVFEGENIIGFIYRDDVFKLLSSGL